MLQYLPIALVFDNDRAQSVQVLRVPTIQQSAFNSFELMQALIIERRSRYSLSTRLHIVTWDVPDDATAAQFAYGITETVDGPLVNLSVSEGTILDIKFICTGLVFSGPAVGGEVHDG
jgi:hypothetical protein